MTWDPTKPEEGGALESGPIRGNMVAIGAMTDPLLQIINAKVAAAACIRPSKISTADGSDDATLAQFLQNTRRGMLLSYGGDANSIYVWPGECMVGGKMRYLTAKTTVNWSNLDGGLPETQKASTWYYVYATASTPSTTPLIRICEMPNVPSSSYYTLLGWFYNNGSQDIEEFRSIGNHGSGMINFYSRGGPDSSQAVACDGNSTNILQTDFDIYSENGGIILTCPRAVYQNTHGGDGDSWIGSYVAGNLVRSTLNHRQSTGATVESITVSSVFIKTLASGVNATVLKVGGGAGNNLTVWAGQSYNTLVVYEF